MPFKVVDRGVFQNQFACIDYLSKLEATITTPTNCGKPVKLYINPSTKFDGDYGISCFWNGSNVQVSFEIEIFLV